MNWLRYLQTLGVFIWVCHGLQAKTGLSPVTLTLTNTNDVALPGRSSCAIRDPTFNMSFEQLRAGESELSCEANDRALPSFGLAGAAIWLRFQVVNRTDESFWYLQLMPNIDRIEYYQVNESGRLTRASVAGRAVPYREYEIGHRNHLFSLMLSPGESATVYLRIQSAGPLWADMELYSRSSFLATEQREQFIFGGYFAALMVIALLNLFFLFASRNRVYLYYIAYLLVFSLNILAVHGYAYQVFWPESPTWNVQAPATLAIATLLLSIFFAMSFLEYPERSVYNRTMKVLIVVLIPLGVSTILSDSPALWILLLPTLLISAVLTFGGGVHRLIQGFRPAGFYVAGWCMLLLFLFAHALALMKIIPFEYISHYYLLGASGLEMLFFTMALAYRHYLLGREKETMVKAIQQERDQLAGEIHDFLGSELTSMILKLESSPGERAGPTNRKLPERAEDARDLALRLRSVLQRLRDIVYLMKNQTPETKRVSVEIEIQEFAERLSATGQCSIQYELSSAGETTLSIKSSLHVVRIFQEWMTNIVRHTNSDSIRVRWRTRGPRRFLSIQNDDAIFQWTHSKNFPADSVIPGRGVGLESIRWRTRELSARARAMRRGANTVFVLLIPIPEGGR